MWGSGGADSDGSGGKVAGQRPSSGLVAVREDEDADADADADADVSDAADGWDDDGDALVASLPVDGSEAGATS